MLEVEAFKASVVCWGPFLGLSGALASPRQLPALVEVRALAGAIQAPHRKDEELQLQAGALPMPLPGGERRPEHEPLNPVHRYRS